MGRDSKSSSVEVTMVDTWMFIVFDLLFSLLLLFPGLVMLLAPKKSFTLASDRFPLEYPPKVELHRKPPSYASTRVLGLLLTLVALFLMSFAVRWMFPSTTVEPSSSESQVPFVVVRWDLLMLTVVLFVAAACLLWRPHWLVDRIVFIVPEDPIKPSTIWLWTLWVRLAGMLALLGCFIPLRDFLRSLQ